MITELKEKIKGFPAQCGVYIMRDNDGRPLYVGKARSLRERIMQYLPPSSDNRYFIELLAKNVVDIEIIITSNEREALLLESELIKKIRPKYNVRLRDDKNYLSVRIEKDAEYPRIDLVRGQKRDGALYFGPYIKSFDLRRLVKLLRVKFRLRTCKDTEFRQRKRPCIQYQIKRCDAPCVDKSEELRIRYQQAIKRCIHIFKGQDREIILELNEEMHQLSEKMRYEEAAVVRDIINLLTELREGQNIVNINAPDMDIFGMKRGENHIALFLLKFREGRIISERSFLFEDVYQDDYELFEDILMKLYLHDDVPSEILLPEEFENISQLKEVFSSPGKDVLIRSAKSGFRANLLEIASKNARFRMQEYLSRNSVLYRLKNRFGLSNLPRKIECYDISHISGDYTVGAKVVAKNGELYKDEYRRYKIERKTEGDDYLSIYEVLTRRMAHIEEEYPDLILVDGGKGQLNTVKKAINDSNISKLPDILAIAKERGDNFNRIFKVGSKNYIKLDENTEEAKLLILLRDEAHRFANDYRERLYKKENL